MQILFYIRNMLPVMIIPIPVILIWRILRIKSMKKKNIKTTFQHEFSLIIFAMFLFGLASQTIFPQIAMVEGKIKIITHSLDFSRISYIPFKGIVAVYKTSVIHNHMMFFIINFFGNITMFMPIGFFPPLLWEKVNTIGKMLLTGFSASLFIEISQIFNGRETDVDDLILNTFGAFLGFLIFRLMIKLFPENRQKFKVQKYYETGR